MFVAAEFALVAVDRGRLDALAAGGDRRAVQARELLHHASFHLSGAQFGITVASLLLGFIAEPSIAHLIEPLLHPLGESAQRALGVAIALLIATVLEMVLGELVPKSLAIAAPERAALMLAPFLRIYGVVFGPLIRMLNGAANWVVRKMGIEPKEELESVRTLSELSVLIKTSAHEGTIADSASRLLTRSIRFTEKCAADVLIPRMQLDAIAAEATVDELVALAASTGHSRFPVFRADIDDVIGVVHVKSVHTLAPSVRRVTPVRSIMVDADIVPETRALQPLLHDMQASRNHLVVVVDEHGGTAGIVTLEDLLEEIVGEIDDEYDALTPAFDVDSSKLDSVVPGSLHADEVEEASGFSMPEGDYETLAGFLLDQLGHVPKVGERVHFDGWVLDIKAMDRRRIVEVDIRRSQPDPTGEAAVGQPNLDPPEGGTS